MHWQANQQFLTQLTLIFKRLLGKVDKSVQHRKWICVKCLKMVKNKLVYHLDSNKLIQIAHHLIIKL